MLDTARPAPMTARPPAVRIAVVGAGFAGTVVTARLLAALTRPAALTLIDANGRFGPGLAYSTDHPRHLMNTRAGTVSAVPVEPAHFTQWLSRQGAAADEDAFVPRGVYGRYLSELLDVAASRSDIPLSRVTAEAIDLVADSRGVTVRLASGDAITADHLVLCVGYGPRLPRRAGSRIVDDPWSDWCDRVAPGDAVLFRGSGLTMVDQALRLVANGHRGRMLAVSRRGLLPTTQTAAIDTLAVAPPPRLRDAVRWLRDTAAAAGDRRGAWRSAVDALRPHAQKLWLGFTPAERDRFARHVQPYWSVHRHRMPPAAAEQIERLLGDAVLKVCAGRLGAPEESAAAVCVPFTSRRRRSSSVLRAHWLVDCSDPQRALAASPLSFALVARGLASAGPAGIAFRVGSDGVFRSGADAVPGLYGLGPPGRDALGEITAIPEIREQAARVAARIAEAVNNGSAVE
ncbi:MAG: FAD/NAD(P)-binding protein [Bauldia sp.]|nr:FAD/NAD(P)-binding protein [Bauldia sp.]